MVACVQDFPVNYKRGFFHSGTRECTKMLSSIYKNLHYLKHFDAEDNPIFLQINLSLVLYNTRKNKIACFQKGKQSNLFFTDHAYVDDPINWKKDIFNYLLKNLDCTPVEEPAFEGILYTPFEKNKYHLHMVYSIKVKHIKHSSFKWETISNCIESIYSFNDASKEYVDHLYLKLAVGK